MAATVASVDGMSKTYLQGKTSVPALRDVTLTIEPGQFTVILGSAGSGKSTLLQCMSGLEPPTSGSVTLDGKELASLEEPELTRLRRDRVGLVFQAFNLVDTLTTRQNITLPADISQKPIDGDLLNSVVANSELEGQLDLLPADLTASEQQRTACARALVTQPAVIFADEPTGNLDPQAEEEVLRVLRRAVSQSGQTVVLATHSPEVASWADRVVVLTDGAVTDDRLSSGAKKLPAEKSVNEPTKEPAKKAELKPRAAASVEPAPPPPTKTKDSKRQPKPTVRQERKPTITTQTPAEKKQLIRPRWKKPKSLAELPEGRPTAPSPANRVRRAPETLSPSLARPADTGTASAPTPKKVGIKQVESLWAESAALLGSLDASATPKEQPEQQADIIARAQQILDGLPGPVTDPE